MAKTSQEAIKYLNRKRCKPSLKIRDNIYSKVDEAYMNGQYINIQFGALRNYHLNAAEKYIATFKKVFIAEVETLDTKCPIAPALTLPQACPTPAPVVISHAASPPLRPPASQMRLGQLASLFLTHTCAW